MREIDSVFGQRTAQSEGIFYNLWQKSGAYKVPLTHGGYSLALYISSILRVKFTTRIPPCVKNNQNILECFYGWVSMQAYKLMEDFLDLGFKLEVEKT